MDALLGYVKRRNADAAGERLIEPETVAAEPREENEPLLRELGLALRSLYDRARDEAGYTPSQLLSMIATWGRWVRHVDCCTRPQSPTGSLRCGSAAAST